MRKKKTQAESTKLLIIETAIGLYKELGYDAVSVQAICDRCGITRGTFYYYFKTKDEMLDDFYLFSDLYAWETIIPALDDKNYLEQFYYIYNIYLERINHVGPLIFKQVLKRIMDTGAPHNDPSNIPMHDIYISLLGKAQKAGEIKNMADPADLMSAIVYLSGGIEVVWCNTKANFDLMQENRRIINTLLFMGSDGA